MDLYTAVALRACWVKEILLLLCGERWLANNYYSFSHWSKVTAAPA